MVKVKDIMKKRVITVDPGINLSDVAKIMTNNRIGSVVVVDKMAPVGIITNDDIVSAVARGKDPKRLKIKQIKKRELVSANPDDSMESITRLMIKSGVKRIPVIKDNKLQGIVSEKEILITSPELIEILSEKLKTRVDRVSLPTSKISGICEGCETYSDQLRNISGKWLCENCMEHER